MQDATRVNPFLGVRHRIAVPLVVSILLIGSVCAQDPRGLKECEQLFSAAVNAEQQKAFVEAEMRYEECRELAQKHRLTKMEASALQRLAVLRARNKKFSESANLFRRALELDPQNATILNDFAQLHADRKDYNEAEKLLKKALDADPDNQKILFNLGTVIASQRAERQAEGLRYLKLAVGEAEAYRELAKIYRAKGELGRAEFVEQRAKSLEDKGPANTSADSQAGNPQPHLPRTPPEIIERNRQELFDANAREILGVPVRHPANESAVGLTPPARALPSAPALPPAHSQPVDPFAALLSRPEPGTSTIRRLKPLPDATPRAPTPIRALPSDTGQVNPPSAPNSIQDPFAPIQTPIPTPETDAVPRETPSPAPGSNGVPRQNREEPNSLRLIRSQVSNAPAENSPAIRSLPAAPESPSTSPVASRPDREPKSEPNVGNPLRAILLGDSALPDAADNVSIIASLPSYSALGGRKIARIDQHTAPQPAAEVPTKKEPASAQPTVTIARQTRPLPVREVNVLQSPSAVGTRRIAPEAKTFSPTPESESKHTVAATPSPAQAKIVQSDRRFSSARSPEVLEFGLARNDSTPPPPKNAETSVEVAVRPLTQNPPPQGGRPVVRLPMIDSPSSDGGSDVAQSKDRGPEIALVVPTPAMESQTPPAETQKPDLATAMPDDPFPLLENHPPQFAEVKNIEPRTESATQLPALADSPAPHSPSTAKMEVRYPPQFAEVKNIEPRMATQLPALADSPPVPADPFSVIADNVTKFAEVKNIEPRTATQLPALADSPSALAQLPQQPPALARFPQQTPPVLAETRRAQPLPPQHLPKSDPMPVSPLPMQMQIPQVAEARPLPVRPAPPLRSAPVREEPAGVASTRRTAESRTATANDQQTGFARSRR